jgi:hypothetical protein
MTTTPAFSPLGRLDWRKAGLGAVSVGLNLALLAALSLTALGIEHGAIPSRPLVYLDIEPRPLLPDERPREPVFAAPSTPLRAAQDTFSADAPPAGADAVADRPTPPLPRLPRPAPDGVPAPSGPWRVDPSNTRNAMARALRQGAIGCASPELLNNAERRHCRERFGERAAAAPPITGSGVDNRERDAAFAREGARRLAQWEMQRRPLSGGVGVVGPADCVGSNFGTGCAGAHLGGIPGVDMQQGARTTHNSGEQRRQGFSARIGNLQIGGDDD